MKINRDYRYKDIDFTFSTFYAMPLLVLGGLHFLDGYQFCFIHNINGDKYKYFLNIVKMINRFSYT